MPPKALSYKFEGKCSVRSCFITLKRKTLSTKCLGASTGLSTGSMEYSLIPKPAHPTGEVSRRRCRTWVIAPSSNVLLEGPCETKGPPGLQAEAQGRGAERLQGLSRLREGELSRPWHGPGPRPHPGAARNWTCSSACAAPHLVWETAYLWGDLASKGAPTPTNYLSKLENPTEPTLSGRCTSHASGHCGSHVIRKTLLTPQEEQGVQRESNTHTCRTTDTPCHVSAQRFCAHHSQPGHGRTHYIWVCPSAQSELYCPGWRGHILTKP